VFVPLQELSTGHTSYLGEPFLRDVIREIGAVARRAKEPVVLVRGDTVIDVLVAGIEVNRQAARVLIVHHLLEVTGIQLNELRLT
jgi:hypothetical protein